MTVPNAADNADSDDEGFAIIPVWLLRDPRLDRHIKLLYVALTSYQTGVRTPYTVALEEKVMSISGLRGVRFDMAVTMLQRIGVLRIVSDPQGDWDLYMIGTHEGAV